MTPKQEREKKWREDHPKRVKQLASDWYKKNQKKHRAYVQGVHLKRKYGVTMAQVLELLVLQGGGCAICGVTSSGKRFWSVDHNHLTLEIRGILCHQCNTGIGFLKDDPTLLRAALAYLTRKDYPHV